MQKANVRTTRFVRFSCALIVFANLATLAQQRPNSTSSAAIKRPLTHVQHLSEAERMSLQAFFENYRDLLNLSSEDEFRQKAITTDQLGQRHYRLQQYYKGLEVADRHFLVHEKNGNVFLTHGDLVAGLNLETRPTLSEARALDFALAHVGAEAYMWENPDNEAFLRREQDDPHATFAPKGELKISAGHNAQSVDDFRLVYRFDIYAERPLGRYAVDVEANTGAIVKVSSLLHDVDVPGTGVSVYNGAVAITVDQVAALSYRLREVGRGRGIQTFDMQRTDNFSNARDFTDTDSEFDTGYQAAGVSVHWAAEATYDYFLNRHGRRSYDNNDAVIRSYAHFDNGWFNAQWDGSRMRFGDGTNNATPLVSIDIVSHEFTHGVTQFSAGLIYANEPGALNESFSDIFGNAVEFFMLGAGGSWEVGEDEVLIRSMSNPRALGDPDTYQGLGWVPTTSTPNNNNDYGGVHTNSGVQNYWFYLLSDGGSGVNDKNEAYAINGLGLEKAESIAYRNLTTYLTPNSGYFDARLGTIYSAMDLYGNTSVEYQTALAAWSAVGVKYPNLDATLVADTDTVRFLAESSVSTDTTVFTITNFGLANLVISALQISGSAFRFLSTPNLPVSLDYGNRVNVSIVFRPTTPSVDFGAVQITSNDPANATTTVSLRGKGFAIRPAAAGSIYANAGRSSAGVLFTINSNDGAGVAIGATNFDELTGMSLRPSDNVIHGTVANSVATVIVRVDAQTGEAYPSVTIPVPNLRAIAFDVNDDLYGAEFTKGKLYRINLANGDTALVGDTNLTLLSGLAFNPVDGSLWAARVGPNVYQIDKTTGAATLIGNSGFARMPELEFDAAGNLFGLSGFALNTVSDFLQINPTTGKGTKIGSTGYNSVYSLVIRGSITTSVAAPASVPVPKIFALAQNHPNPFNPSTQITFSLPATVVMTLKIFDLAGREVATLVNGKLPAGEHHVHFDASDLAAGVYLYRLQAGEQVATRKLLLVK